MSEMEYGGQLNMPRKKYRIDDDVLAPYPDKYK
jgi:hypothetical protein